MVRRVLPALLTYTRNSYFTLKEVRELLPPKAEATGKLSSVLVELEKQGVLTGDHSKVPTRFRFSSTVLNSLAPCPLCGEPVKYQAKEIWCDHCFLSLSGELESLFLRWNLRV